MSNINYNNKVFKAIVNDDSGYVTSQTSFFYHQKNDIIWAEYHGGGIIMGTITGKVTPNGKLEFYFQHVTNKEEMMCGYCESTPEIRFNGRIRLFEKWKFLDGVDTEGMSIVEEVILNQ